MLKSKGMLESKGMLKSKDRLRTKIASTLFLLIGCWSPSLSAIANEPTVTEVATANLVARFTTTQMADRVDELLVERLTREGVKPSRPASDAVFLRRASLDITGLIPSVSEARQFLNRQVPFDGPDRRAQLIDRLLSSAEHPRHLASRWQKAMLPEETNTRRFGGVNGLESWLIEQFAVNRPYDAMVAEILQATGAPNQASPALFFTAANLEPEQLASRTASVFLGVQIGCAQCHDHPFDHWTSTDFWSLAAFFSQMQRPNGRNALASQVADTELGEIKLPGTDQVLPPRFLDGNESPDGETSRRARLAHWGASRDNPYFSKAAVNRVWALMFGRGLVDPIDDLGDHNLSSHPKLLEELSLYFIERDFDTRQLIRVLASTQAYQRSSQIESPDDERPELFARMTIKNLTAEQLYDCLNDAMRRREDDPSAQQAYTFAGNERDRFVAKFKSTSESVAEFQTGIPQALTMMNGDVIANATQVANSDILAALNAPFFTDEERLNTLFLSTLTRKPNEAEQAKLLPYIKRGGTADDRNQALGDVLWALLNSAEFMLNH